MLWNSKIIWYWVRGGVLPKFELHIFGIVGQKGQKWVNLGKIAVFMLHHMTLWLEYYDKASNIWYWVRDEVSLKFELHIFGIVGQKDQKWVKLDKTSVFILNHVTFWLEYDEIVPLFICVWKSIFKFKTSILLLFTMGISVKKAQKRQNVPKFSHMEIIPLMFF